MKEGREKGEIEPQASCECMAIAHFEPTRGAVPCHASIYCELSCKSNYEKIVCHRSVKAHGMLSSSPCQYEDSEHPFFFAPKYAQLAARKSR